MGHISNGEYLVSILLEQAFPGHKFELIKPEWLLNPITNGIMELDLYNEELNLAVEYQGMFHFCETEITNPRTLRKYQSLLRNDSYKKQICIERGINFITVDYDLNYINVIKVRNYLYGELIKFGYNIPKEFLNMKIEQKEYIDIQDTENYLSNIEIEEFYFEHTKDNPEIYLNAINRLLVKLSLFGSKIRELERENRVLDSENKKINFSRNILFNKIEELCKLKEECESLD